jgi:hypothetical protein
MIWVCPITKRWADSYGAAFSSANNQLQPWLLLLSMQTKTMSLKRPTIPVMTRDEIQAEVDAVRVKSRLITPVANS